MKIFLPAVSVVLAPSRAWAQQVPDFLLQEPGSLGEGWQGFTDVGFLSSALLTLVLATVLGAVIAYHPKHLGFAACCGIGDGIRLRPDLYPWCADHVSCRR